MSAGGSGAPAEGAVDANVLLAVGIIGGLIGIYASAIHPVIGPVISCLGAVCAILWGVLAIRSVASYGLGTGVPSIGYMSLGIGVIGALAGVGIIAVLGLNGLEMLGPILALAFAMLIGLLVAIVAKKIVGMKIPVMERCTAEIAGAAALSVLGFSAAIAGGYSIDLILNAVVAPGFIAVFYILCTMAIQHPFNACLGPNEDQVRTLKCGASTAFLTMIITGILAISAGGIAWFVILVVGLIGWYVSFKMFVNASCEAAASVKWSGLWPKVEE
ncbi:tetrahydromethanopterin S-methyltransferase subunit MtrC [Methanobrevibacter sp.]|uniref:tetrahydromethanopterin S-methyltransferase subunit MtrC n=1 Tax=Methanobrevibacter sp. TaxID=66852 RepID=UPI0025ECBD8C|nr:tetrahydromethanopterin S-methyltransferase subunit C [Methanobrevibacter sp.]MBQ2962131.1 tetrahydromethanopterin S-methyltransferase subunit C [Methanobrevibacter sp.]